MWLGQKKKNYEKKFIIKLNKANKNIYLFLKLNLKF